MDYITVAEIAAKWGVNIRQVQRLIAANRIPGVKQYGKTFVIPADAEKPADPRKGRIERGEPYHINRNKPQKPLSRELEEVFAALPVHLPLDDPDAALNMVSDHLRVIPETRIAYLRGDHEYVIRRYNEIEGSDAVKLVVSCAAIAAAVSLEDYPCFLEVENWLKGIVKASTSQTVTACAELALANAYMGAGAPDMVSDWLKDWDFAALPELLRRSAAYICTLYLRWQKKYEIMLAAAQASLVFCVSEHGLISEEANFKILCANACYALDRPNDAERYLLSAMAKTLPLGFITPFAEYLPVFGGLLERLLHREFPSYYNAVIEQSKRTIKNWLTFHNRFTKDNITLILSLREYAIALLLTRRTSRSKIAKQYHIADSTLNNIIETIYEKLGVSGRDDLNEFII